MIVRFCVLFFALGCAFVNADEINDNSVETVLMQRLARIQLQSNNPSYDFVTDGCSGGLSSGWKWMADTFPVVKNSLSEKPWWESCCVAHDIAYWQGDVNNGVELRRQADDDLRACVVARGDALADELSIPLKIRPDEVRQTFVVAANLMYHAVRIGGLPCTRLPWRWGYGWPHCE